MKLKKMCLLSVMMLSMASVSATSIFSVLGHLMSGGMCLAGAAYTFEKTKKEYGRATTIWSKHCTPITQADFDHDPKIVKEKCYCYLGKYKEVIPMALLTVLLGGLGARFVIKGIFK